METETKFSGRFSVPHLKSIIDFISEGWRTNFDTENVFPV